MKPLSEELKTGLYVESDINLHIGENTTAHFTDKYECTEDRKTDDGKDEAAELVLRRGKPFKMTITCNRPFRPKDDDLFIVLRTGESEDYACCYHMKITRPLGLRYNHQMSPSIRGQLVKMLITLEPHGIF